MARVAPCLVVQATRLVAHLTSAPDVTTGTSLSVHHPKNKQDDRTKLRRTVTVKVASSADHPETVDGGGIFQSAEEKLIQSDLEEDQLDFRELSARLKTPRPLSPDPKDMKVPFPRYSILAELCYGRCMAMRMGSLICLCRGLITQSRRPQQQYSCVTTSTLV
jgi:hypothetical protein